MALHTSSYKSLAKGVIIFAVHSAHTFNSLSRIRWFIVDGNITSQTAIMSFNCQIRWNSPSYETSISEA
jgi:hypothetical protein